MDRLELIKRRIAAVKNEIDSHDIRVEDHENNDCCDNCGEIDCDLNCEDCNE